MTCRQGLQHHPPNSWSPSCNLDSLVLAMAAHPSPSHRGSFLQKTSALHLSPSLLWCTYLFRQRLGQGAPSFRSLSHGVTAACQTRAGNAGGTWVNQIPKLWPSRRRVLLFPAFCLGSRPLLCQKSQPPCLHCPPARDDASARGAARAPRRPSTAELHLPSPGLRAATLASPRFSRRASAPLHRLLPLPGSPFHSVSTAVSPPRRRVPLSTLSSTLPFAPSWRWPHCPLFRLGTWPSPASAEAASAPSLCTPRAVFNLTNLTMDPPAP